jgi:hypothetical protein
VAVTPEEYQRVIERVDALIDAAREVQNVPDEGEAKVLLGRLHAKYVAWREEARDLISEDLLPEFDDQYQSSTTGWQRPWRIVEFLQRALQKPDAQSFPGPPASMPTWLADAETCFCEPITAQKMLLIRARVRYGRDSAGTAVLDSYQAIFRRLHRVVSVLTGPGHAGRMGMAAPADEYDIQRIIHALLVALSDDVDPEAWSDRSLGTTPRMDFFLREERVSVEAKFVHHRMTPRRLGDEINQDIRRYGSDDRVRAMFFVIFDPARRLVNPAGLENDANRANSLKPVRIVVAQ